MHRKRETTLSFPPDSACLAGHFPGNPVVPAAAILASVTDWAEREVGRKVAGVASARFRRPLRPGATWRLVLEEGEPNAVLVTGRDADRIAMTLRLRVEPV
jgi:3-hydroxymyristoyl/3-hydroxydecanoyl-(acyl carrier protein) dehydratase